MVPHGTDRHPRCPKWLNTGVKGTKPLSEPLPCYPRLAEEQSNYPGWVIAALFLPMLLHLGLSGLCLDL